MRATILEKLNSEYMEAIQAKGAKMSNVYKAVMENNPYRALSGYTYEEHPKLIRSQRNFDEPAETDIAPGSRDDVSKLTDEEDDEFRSNMLRAQKEANKTNKGVYVK